MIITQNNYKLNFIEECKNILSPIIEESGGILYSSGDTLQKGTFYILGLNPGGNNGPTICDSLNKIFLSKENAYLDEDWSTEKRVYGIGGHPLQRNLKYLFDYLGYNLRDICSSNLIFVRSPDQNGCNFNFNANLCWKVHERILEIINPKALFVFGNSKISPYAFIMNLHKNNADQILLEEENIKSEHGKWLCRCFRTNIFGNNILVIGLPHLSVYKIIGRENILIWIKEKVNSCI